MDGRNLLCTQNGEVIGYSGSSNNNEMDEVEKYSVVFKGRKTCNENILYHFALCAESRENARG